MGKYEEAIPQAKNLIHSLRDIGYSLKTATADIIDNSITAEASKIDIFIDYAEENSSICIVDNGYGMRERELNRAS